MILTFEDHEENMIDWIVSCGDGMAFVKLNAKQPQCPLEKEKAIMEAFEYFEMI